MFCTLLTAVHCPALFTPTTHVYSALYTVIISGRTEVEGDEVREQILPADT